MKKKLRQTTVIIPAFNEAESVGKTVRELINLYPDTEIIVVNDGSDDHTAEEAENAGALVITHINNLGYGAALKKGIRTTDNPFIVTFDADGQHNAEDITRLLNAMDDVDMVVGSRHKDSGYPWKRIPGKYLLAKFADLLAGQSMPDFNSGLRVFRKEVIENYLHLMPPGFSFSATSTFAFLKASKQIRWIPVNTNQRKGKSSVRQVFHGPQVILVLLKLALLFAPLKVFLPFAAVMMAMSLTIILYTITHNQGITDSAVMFFTGSLLVFFFGLMTDQISASRREKFE